MTKKVSIFVAVIVLIIGGVFLWRPFSREENNQNNPVGIQTVPSSIYENTAVGFSFEKPDGYTIGEVGGEDDVTFLVQSDKGAGFQIFVSFSFEDPGAVITKDWIQRDIPDIKITNDKIVSIGGISAFQFESDNELFGGHSLEIWFVRDGSLYQISGYFESKELVEKTIKTWRWTE
jgi:hypothetical protein